jgi:tRNA (guanine-N7-)-methyltransferase
MAYFSNMHYAPSYNPSRLKWDIEKRAANPPAVFSGGQKPHVLEMGLFERSEKIWMEVGAGTGAFFADMAAAYPDRLMIALERCKLRGKRLEKKATKAQLPNFVGYRGNAIPAMIDGVPSGRLERIYILYPCPWPKNAQRKNRWYLHPMMPHLVRALEKDGLLIWASDQKFYIDEARWICETVYGLKVLVHGEIAPNQYNDLHRYDGGRTQFEKTFLGKGQPCYELIVQTTNRVSDTLNT